LEGGDFGLKILVIMSGHISRLTMGDSVWPIT
jgi:hypothetical protein